MPGSPSTCAQNCCLASPGCTGKSPWKTPQFAFWDVAWSLQARSGKWQEKVQRPVKEKVLLNIVVVPCKHSTSVQKLYLGVKMEMME